MRLRPFGLRFILALATLGVCLDITLPAQAGPAVRWRDYVGTCLDTLITKGTDRYGSVHSDMLVSILDVNTLDCPQTPEWLDSEAYYEPGRSHRRAMAGANFWYDQETIRAMYRLSSMTGDTHYAAGADRTINAFYNNAIRNDTGLPAWGTHTFYNVFTDQRDGDPNGQHEILVYDAQWSSLYAHRPTETRAVVDKIWDRCVGDKTTGQFDRHDSGGFGCDFAVAGGAYISAFATLYNKTQDSEYLNRAMTVENWHWSHRNLVTNLIPDAPSATGQYEATHCMTSVTGPYVGQLLNAYELTGNATFRDHALTYLKAYEQYGWDSAAGTYCGMLNLDGTPVPYNPSAAGYDVWAPTGPVDMWKTSIYGEFPLTTAQSMIRAYELTGDPDLLAAAEHWASAIQQDLPVKLGKRFGDGLLAAMPELENTNGSYAEDYGRVISFFVHLYAATNDNSYLQIAEQVGQDAVDKLFVNGIFRGHVAKPYYESTDGVGVLLDAMLELDGVSTVPEPSPVALFYTGLVGLVGYAWRKRRVRARLDARSRPLV